MNSTQRAHILIQPIFCAKSMPCCILVTDNQKDFPMPEFKMREPE
jgi:hypothetical protein